MIKARILITFLVITTTFSSFTLKQGADHITAKYNSVVYEDTIPKPVGYVNDFENLLTVVQEKTLDSIITAYEKRTSVEIAVLTFSAKMSARKDLDEFTLNVLNTWGIGKKDKNNGILIAVSAGYRFVRIENGYGIEKIMTDEETKKIIDSAMLPFFKEGKYYDGILNGINTLTRTLNGK